MELEARVLEAGSTGVQIRQQVESLQVDLEQTRTLEEELNMATDEDFAEEEEFVLLFDDFFKPIHTFTLSMSHINNQNNTNITITANMVIMRIINNTT